MLKRTAHLLVAVTLVLSASTACSGDDSDEPDKTPDPTLAGPSESLVAPPGTGDPDVVISKTEVCSDQPVSGGAADGRFYGSVTMLAGGSLTLSVRVDEPAGKSRKKRTVDALVDSKGGFVGVFPVFGEGETLTLTSVEASGLGLTVPEATLEVTSLDSGECPPLDLPIPPIAEDD